MPNYIDHRERAEVISLAKTVLPSLEVIQLPLGDIFLTQEEGGGVLIERKSVSDFITSMRSNHLWEQLLRMLKTKELLGIPIHRRILLIHGTFDSYLIQFADMFTDGSSPTKFWNSLSGAFQEIIFVYDTPIIFAENDQAFTAFLETTLKRELKHKNDASPKPRWHHKRVRKDLPIKDSRKILLSAIPSIGESLAGSLLDSFSTIKDVACANSKDLLNTPGIGKKKAQLIYDFFH